MRNHRHRAARNGVLNWKHLGTKLSHQGHQSAATGDFQLAENGAPQKIQLKIPGEAV
jgi:hypothetical protein